MREYVMQDWNVVVVLVIAMVLSIWCQLVMIYHMRNLIKEREEMQEPEKGKIAIKYRESGEVNPCKKVAIPAFTML